MNYLIRTCFTWIKSNEINSYKKTRDMYFMLLFNTITYNDEYFKHISHTSTNKLIYVLYVSVYHTNTYHKYSIRNSFKSLHNLVTEFKNVRKPGQIQPNC
jgi:hypothetical protein